MEKNEQDKDRKKSVLGKIAKTAIGQGGSVIHKGIEAAKKGIDRINTALTASEEKAALNEFIAGELARKLSIYYNGMEPEIIGIDVSRRWTAGEFNVSATAVNLHSTSSGVQKADVKAEVRITEQFVFHMPTPGIDGMDSIQPAYIPVFDTEPDILRIALEVTNSTYTPDSAYNRIQETIVKKYPYGNLIDKTVPLSITNETLFCDRLISDNIPDFRGRNKRVVRFIRFTIKRVPVDKKVDECLFVKDYEYQLQPSEELFTIDFPKPSEVAGILRNEKPQLRRLIYGCLGSGSLNTVRMLSFRIGRPEIEPSGGASGAPAPERSTVPVPASGSGTALTCRVEFYCTVGLVRHYRVATDLFYAIDPVAGKKGGRTSAGHTMALRYLWHGDFVVIHRQG